MMRKSLLSLLPMLLSTAAIAAEHDGFFNVSYNNIGFSLTQIGGYGELTIEPQGFKSMAFGACKVNFTRDEAGLVQQMSPIATLYSAQCPEAVKFSVAPAKDGLYQISFSEGGDLAGESFDLYPVLVPMNDGLKVTAPAGFDIMGMSPGQSRAEIEAILAEKGFSKNERWSEVLEYQDMTKRSLEVWQKGTADYSTDAPEDAIHISYNLVSEGDEELALLVGRKWHVPQSANLSITNLKKSLDDKHGATTSGFEKRYYDRSGQLAPKAFQPVCDENIHIQAVEIPYITIGSSGSVFASPACGALVDIMTIDSFDVEGGAGQLLVTLSKGDLMYEDFWKSWSVTELKGLQERFELQSNLTGSAPEL